MSYNLYIEDIGGYEDYNSNNNIYGYKTLHDAVNEIGTIKADISNTIAFNNIFTSGLTVKNDVSFLNDVFIENDLFIRTNLDITNDLFIHNKTILENDVSCNNSMDISENFHVHNKTILENDASFNSNVDISENFHVHNKTILENDASFNSNVDISENFHVHNKTVLENDASFNSNVDISENFHVHNKTVLENDASFNSNVDISENFHVHNKTVLENDASFNSNVDISENVHIHNKLTVENDAFFKNNIIIGNNYSDNVVDVSMIIYGDLKIMKGGNLLIQDVENTTITQLQTEVKITDTLKITNDGTSPALTVNQIDSLSNDILHVQDSGINVFTIKDGGNIDICGNIIIEKDVSMNSDLFVSNNINSLGTFGLGTQTPDSILDISGTDAIKIPHGISNQRPSIEKYGQIRYNTEINKFEGYTYVDNWEILNGLTDIDLDTFIKVENNNDNNNDIQMFTTGVERMMIDNSGTITMFNSDPSYAALDISAITALQIPHGKSDERPSIEKYGQIRYNTEINKFEGYTYVDNWEILNGLTDIDKDTFIKVENNNDNNNDIQMFTAGNERMKIDASGVFCIFNTDPSYNALDISATTALRIPIGSTVQRPDITNQRAGQIRYNTTNSQFEGYNTSNSWQGLGGVIDIDQDTYILAESSPNADNDEIQIYTDGAERMKIDASGVIRIFNTDPSYAALDISATTALKIPIGSTQERPSTQNQTAGQIRYNTTNSQFEGYNTSNSWQGLGGVIDIDQDTYILAETSPLDDNDEIQIYTDGHERMKIDACGNVQMGNSKTSNAALDISSTSAISIPRGSIYERPTNAEIPRSLRFNSDTSLCEVYTESNIWSGIPVYKAEQPPKLLNVMQNKLSETVTVTWEKFADIYKDVFDGKCYPIYLQTFVDISFTNINSTSSNGWKTIIVGSGNYDELGNYTTPLTSFTFNGVVSTDYNNNNITTGNNYSDITFINKPSTIDLSVFTQDDLFDLRIYGINKSGTIPNYIYIYNVQLKQTGVPGDVDIIDFESFQKKQLNIDLSFNLDSNDTSITSGISITHYDVSFTLTGSKSLEDRIHIGNQFTNWVNSTSLDKNNIGVSGLFPGAQYDIQVRAQNALKLDTTTDTGYMYGIYGDSFTSSGFTNNNNDTTGTNTSEYIDTVDLNSVNHGGMTFTLVNNNSIYCYLNNGSSITNRTILNTYGEINISGTSSFYVNYGKQGTDMVGETNLVTATVILKKNNSTVSTNTIEYDGINYITTDPSTLNSINISIQNNSSDSFVFSSSSYTDQGNTSNYNKGFVYSSTLHRSDTADDNTMFNSNFTASTDSYSLEYNISTNTSDIIDENGNTTTSNSTGNFFVDDYIFNSSSILEEIDSSTYPLIQINSTSSLFGIISILTLNTQAQFTIKDFANNIIPHINESGGNLHSKIDEINDKNSYSFDSHLETDKSTNLNYDLIYNKSSNITSNTYDANTTSTLNISINYLDNSSDTPSIETYTNASYNTPNIGYIFKDIYTNYTVNDLYIFNGTSVITSSSINTSDQSFTTTYSSYLSSMLIYFNSKFVSGGFSAYYSGTSISPFSNWSSGYAVNGPNYSIYSDTGINNYKWIAIDVTNKKSGNNVDLSSFLVNNSSPILSKFGTYSDEDGYESYIYQDDGKFGALNKASNGSATLWFNNSSYHDSIDNSKSGAANGALQSDGVNAFVDSTHSGSIYLIIGLVQDKNVYFTYS